MSLRETVRRCTTDCFKARPSRNLDLGRECAINDELSKVSRKESHHIRTVSNIHIIKIPITPLKP